MRSRHFKFILVLRLTLKLWRVQNQENKHRLRWWWSCVLILFSDVEGLHKKLKIHVCTRFIRLLWINHNSLDLRFFLSCFLFEVRDAFLNRKCHCDWTSRARCFLLLVLLYLAASCKLSMFVLILIYLSVFFFRFRDLSLKFIFHLNLDTIAVCEWYAEKRKSHRSK